MSCTAVTQPLKFPFFFIFLIATRETAYVHAISAAAITHRITTECKKGKIPGCTCAIIKKTHKPDDDWQWGGCSDNIKYGEKMTKRFIDKLENGNDARAAFNLHNNEAGRRVSFNLNSRFLLFFMDKVELWGTFRDKTKDFLWDEGFGTHFSVPRPKIPGPIKPNRQSN